MKRLALLALLLTGCLEAIDHQTDGGADAGFDGGTDAGTDACHHDSECACAQACIGAPTQCTPVSPSTCDATTHCDVLIPGSSCTAVFRFGSLCGYHACQLPDGGP